LKIMMERQLYEIFMDYAVYVDLENIFCSLKEMPVTETRLKNIDLK